MVVDRVGRFANPDVFSVRKAAATRLVEQSAMQLGEVGVEVENLSRVLRSAMQNGTASIAQAKLPNAKEQITLVSAFQVANAAR